MNRTLEEMARALFKSWFVDFEPVRYKAAGQGPRRPTLFPDSFQDSELGEIPKGWKLGTLATFRNSRLKTTSSREPETQGTLSLLWSRWYS
jgi:type I restriction enzyme S subunit